MEAVFILAQVFDKGENPALIKKVVPFFRPIILDADGEAFIEKGQFSQALGEHFKAEGGRFKDLRVGFESDLSPGMFRLSRDLKLRLDLPPFVELMVHLPIPSDLQFHKL